MSERASGISRRRLLAGAGAGIVGLGLGASGAVGYQHLQEGGSSPLTNEIVPFRGRHQAGIATPAQHYLHFAAFDVTNAHREDVVRMLQAWTAAAEHMAGGELAADPTGETEVGPPGDTGEAMDLSAGALTVTFGFGASLFEKDGADRFGLRERRPTGLIDLPVFNGDRLDPARSDGDIMVQACAEDPQIAFHAIRNLARIGRGTVVMRWSQLGFSRTSSTSRSQDTPRNLMGFKDGTNNINADDDAAMDESVWVGDEDQPWMAGGTFAVIRRIRMLIEVWDRASLLDQEQTIGRFKVSGAPLGALEERDPPNLTSTSGGEPVIPASAHIRLAAPSENGGHRILRRGYSFTDGMDSYGQLDAGLFFIAFQRDPRAQFVSLQKKLADNDALNEYIRHTASGIYAVPPGARDGEWIGQALFEA